MKKWWVVVAVLVAQLGQGAFGQRLDGFAQIGYSQGFSILAAMQVSFEAISQVRVGVRGELLYADGNGDTGDNPKLEVQPFAEFTQPIYQDNAFNAALSLTLRPYLRVFSSTQGGQYGLIFDASARITAGINMGYRVNDAFGVYFGFGVGTQLGIFTTSAQPSTDLILFNYLYSYVSAQYDLRDFGAPGLTAILGGGGAPNVSRTFAFTGFDFNAYAGLEYQLTNQYGLRFQLGYSSSRGFGSYDTPESNGFYVALRAFLR